MSMQPSLFEFTGRSDVTVYATPTDTDEEGDHLPFWKKYIEEHYRPRRVVSGRYRVIEYNDRYYVARISGKYETLILDKVVSDRLGVSEGVVRATLASGNMEKAKELLKAYLEKIRDALETVEQDGDGYAIIRIQMPTEQFEDDVLAGNIIDPETGLKLSLRQAKGRPPESGFLQEVSRFFVEAEDYTRAKEMGRLGYARGVVVKICGDYDPSLTEHHNTWAVITDIIDAYHYEVVKEWTGERIIIRDTDVKGIIGTFWHDFVGIGPERHRREVVPVIKKALSGKIPIPEGCYPMWPRPPLRQALVVAYLDYGFDKPLKQVICRALVKSRNELKTIESRKEKYEKEDFRIERGKALLWVRLYEILSKKVERLERLEGVCVLFRNRRRIINKAVNSLKKAGIPYKVRGCELIVLKEDYEDAWRALIRP